MPSASGLRVPICVLTLVGIILVLALPTGQFSRDTMLLAIIAGDLAFGFLVYS